MKPIFKKLRPHKVRQMAVVLLKRKYFNYSDGLCWTIEQRDYQYLQHSRNAPAGKQAARRIQLFAENHGAQTETLDVYNDPDRPR